MRRAPVETKPPVAPERAPQSGPDPRHCSPGLHPAGLTVNGAVPCVLPAFGVTRVRSIPAVAFKCGCSAALDGRPVPHGRTRPGVICPPMRMDSDWLASRSGLLGSKPLRAYVCTSRARTWAGLLGGAGRARPGLVPPPPPRRSLSARRPGGSTGAFRGVRCASQMPAAVGPPPVALVGHVFLFCEAVV